MMLRYSDFKEGMTFKNKSVFEISIRKKDVKDYGFFFPEHLFTLKEIGIKSLVFATGEDIEIEVSFKEFLEFGFYLVTKKTNEEVLMEQKVKTKQAIQKILDAYYEPGETEEDSVYDAALGFALEEFQHIGLIKLSENGTWVVVE